MDATAQELIARLRRDPDDAASFAALRTHYQRMGDWASLANLLEGWAGRSRDPQQAAQALFDAGELVLGALSDTERAIRIYERALASDARHQEAFLRLRSLFEDANDTRRQAELFERHTAALLQAGGDARDVALLYHELGELWEHRFSRVDKAVHYYRKAFELDPQLVPAIYAAREIYRQAGNIKAAALLLDKESKAEVDPARRVALARELAHLRAEQLGDPEGAITALKRALSEAPGDLDVMNDLALLYLSRADHGEDAHHAANDRGRAADLFLLMAQKLPPDHALPLLEQCLDLSPDHDAALTWMEHLCDEIGQIQFLPARWVAFLAAVPDGAASTMRRRRLAEAYLDAGQIDYAISCLEWLLADGDAVAAQRLVGLYREQGREDEAIHAMGVASRTLPAEQRIPRLRELVSVFRDRGDLQGAASCARSILEVDPADPEALNLVEDACRQSGDFGPLREVLLAASRVSGLGADVRKQRLKDVATLSEKQLRDIDGAISAWRGVAALDPADREARAALKRLLVSTERWDDLVGVLEREALSITEPPAKAEVYRELATIHRERRGDLNAAVAALQNLRDLVPDDRPARDALCDALLDAGAIEDAIPLLRQRVDDARGADRAPLLQQLATVLEEKLHDPDAAFEAWARLLDENPADTTAIAHMEAIDEAAGRHERLLSTLGYRVEVTPAAERPAVLARMGAIAERDLDDLDRAAELYASALELAPGDSAILDALCHVYDRAARYRDLVTLLRDNARVEKDPARRSELYRRIARTLTASVGNDEGAAEAYREVLRAGDDDEALRFLRQHASVNGDIGELQDVLRRLALVSTQPNEIRDLVLERADLLADELQKPHEAVELLRRVVDELSPDHLMALGRLAALCEGIGDREGLADGLWRQLRVLDDPSLRLPVAMRLADLHERENPDPARAIDALNAWVDADPMDADPLVRLLPLLETAERFGDLVAAYDALAGLTLDDDEMSAHLRRAASIAHQKLGDVDGAWARLEPRVREEDAAAEADLEELARASGRGERLAELYVAMAQGATDGDDQVRRWTDAARIYDELLADPARALEAVLRALAIDLGNTLHLDDADRLAERAGAWPRLAQVYETLVRRATDAHSKIELLLRHAQLLDTRAHDVSASLDHTLRACALAPDDDAILALAEERAPRADRADELLVTYDKRKQRAEDDAGRIEALLRALTLCERTLKDRVRSAHYLALALALTARSTELTPIVEGAARDLDSLDGAPGGLRRAAVDIYRALADGMDADPATAASLLLRAARVLSEELDRDSEAFDVLRTAAMAAPGETAVLDRLEEFARRLERLPELDRFLAQQIDEALDNRTASELLRRRGRLLDQTLERYADAADVWTRLSTVNASDLEARERLRICLRKAGLHQDLLVALQRDLRRSSEPSERVAILREIAGVWDKDLGNRWEAVDAWKKVLKEAPGDADATAAIASLDQGRRERANDSGSLDLGRAPAAADDEIDLDAESDSLELSERETSLDGDLVDGELADSDIADYQSDWRTPAILEAAASTVTNPFEGEASEPGLDSRNALAPSSSTDSPLDDAAESVDTGLHGNVLRELDVPTAQIQLPPDASRVTAQIPTRGAPPIAPDEPADVLDELFAGLEPVAPLASADPTGAASGELELFDEHRELADDAEDLDDAIDLVSGLEPLDDVVDSGVEELDELDDLDDEELVAGPQVAVAKKSTRPPPPPRSDESDARPRQKTSVPPPPPRRG